MASIAPLKPTAEKMIMEDTIDAMLIVQNCLEGNLTHIARRPGDKEREKLIASGNIFCYEENASGIRRWTDGIPWSPSRILGNCLVYRELCEAFPPGEKKKANKTKPKRSNGGAAISGPGGSQQPLNTDNEPDRKWIGSLAGTYRFKEGGLVKKTISFSYRNVTHHVVSYYTLDDAKNGNLTRPIENQFFVRPIAQELWGNPFRTPLDQEMAMFQTRTPMHDVFMNEIMRNPPFHPQLQAQFQAQFQVQFHPPGVQVQQYYTPGQQHPPQQHPPQQHPPQQHPPQQHPPQQHPPQQHPPQLYLLGPGIRPFPDAPLNDPTRQHLGDYMGSDGDYMGSDGDYMGSGGDYIGYF